MKKRTKEEEREKGDCNCGIRHLDFFCFNFFLPDFLSCSLHSNNEGSVAKFFFYSFLSIFLSQKFFRF